MDLRVERTRADVQIKALARELGCSRAWVTKYEQRADVPPAVAQRYREGLARAAARRDGWDQG